VLDAHREEQSMTAMLDQSRHPATTATPCRRDPDRWAAGGHDPELKALCRGCHRRWLCAKEALETPGAEGMWSGVHIPSSGRPRTFALRQLRSLATYAGLTVRDPEPAAR
jgi:WhiB family transcriptional regulator, redox-sensing transcriptional regulator